MSDGKQRPLFETIILYSKRSHYRRSKFMRTIPENFPSKHLEDPTRRAKAAAFQAFKDSPIDGLAIYGWQQVLDGPDVDFVVWLKDRFRAAWEIKGGPHYLNDQGHWFLRTEQRPVSVSPVKQAKRGAMRAKKAVRDTIDRAAYFIAVLHLPDMEPDERMIQDAAQEGVYVVFGMHDPVEQSITVAANHEEFYPPKGHFIDNEEPTFANRNSPVVPNADAPVGEPPTPTNDLPAGQLELRATNIVIHHIDKLVLQILPGDTSNTNTA